MLRLFDTFAGIGATHKALKNIGINVELVGYSENNKYADCCYRAIHGVSQQQNYGDITTLQPDLLPDFDIMNFSFPCKDISNAGKMKGFTHNGKITHSGLYTYGTKIIKSKQPSYIMTENVSNLISKKFFSDFAEILKELESLGYNNYWQLLNARDYNLPQNRKRVIVISIRKDVDKQTFEFPKPIKSTILLKDLLEREFDDKYIFRNTDNFIDIIKDNNSYMAKVKEATKLGYAIANIGDSINLEYPTSKTRRGRVGKEVAQTLTVSCNQGTLTEDGQIRKFLPKECWLLQGFTKEDYNKATHALQAEFGDVADSQIYERAGRTIPVAMLENVFKQLFAIE